MRYFQCSNDVCTFHQVKLGNGQNKTKTLCQLIDEINQTNFRIDILKIDIEYGEYVKPVYIQQILVVRKKKKSINFSISYCFIFQEVQFDRDRTIETNALFYLFNSQNYIIYHRELNPNFSYYASEYVLLKLNRTFLVINLNVYFRFRIILHNITRAQAL
ncbi:unnamed protein product [Rotaria sordida]|uniref:Uncharacterized protein n=1 Tax=Rotaria sordida TaxID=392033 RepID=A0A818GM42_9BILA|nr:unnamed protein product [Rotaria sordida]CAF3491926.1 unnamed protein product [Rotaria sordida]